MNKMMILVVCALLSTTAWAQDGKDPKNTGNAAPVSSETAAITTFTEIYLKREWSLDNTVNSSNKSIIVSRSGSAQFRAQSRLLREGAVEFFRAESVVVNTKLDAKIVGELDKVFAQAEIHQIFAKNREVMLKDNGDSALKILLLVLIKVDDEEEPRVYRLSGSNKLGEWEKQLRPLFNTLESLSNELENKR